ncbi:MAG TPA: glycosyltransferase family 4 protein [Humisphaera sp.]|nr:glycosyltransferase family 4 protein [Humisphaera sp.]
MRVVHVTDTFLPKIGGAEIAIDQLVRAMGGLGVECIVLAKRNRGVSGDVDVPYRLQRFSRARSDVWAGAWLDWNLSRLVRKLGPVDAVIGHHAFPPGYGAVRFARRHGIPAIVYPRGGDIYYTSRLRRKRLAWRRLTWTLANASAVVCASAAMEAIAREIAGAQSPIVRIPNGVNFEELRADSSTSRLQADPRLRDPFVLGLGRVIERKGLHLLVDAFAKGAAPPWRLVIAGDGRDLPALRARAASLGDRVVFTGMVEGADKRWVLRHCQFMAAPSLEESFGNAALEAMACGKPVVVSGASGLAEFVNNGEGGIVVPVGEVEPLAAALARYTTTDLSAASAAAERAAQEFTWPSIARQYIALIEQLVGRTFKPAIHPDPLSPTT